jgi:pilus assembly protein Flp/PilA
MSVISALEKRPALMRQGLIVKSRVLKFLRDESGATAIEYGLIAAGIAIAIITVVKGVGTKLNTTFTSVSSALK